MKKVDHISPPSRAHRRPTERAVPDSTAESPPAIDSDNRSLVHELQVHQVELEMQNEELRRAHTELTTLGAKYRELYEFAPVGYLTIDTAGRVLEANFAGATLLGIARRDLVQRRFSSLLSAASQAVFPAFVRRLRDTGGRQTAEFSVSTGEGTLRYLQTEAALAGSPEADEGDIRLAIVDVTERRRLEDLSRESAQQFRSVFDQSPLGIVFEDFDCRFIRTNGRFCEMLGYTEEALLSMRLQDIMHPDDLLVEANADRNRLGGVSASNPLDTRYLHKSGDVVWVHVFASLMRDGQNRPLHFLKVVEDITEQKIAELALRRSEALVQTLKALKTLPQTDAFIEQVLASLIACLNAISASLWLYDQERGLHRPHTHYAEGRMHSGAELDKLPALDSVFARDSPLLAAITEARHPVAVDLTAIDGSQPDRQALLAQGIQSALYVPLLLGDEAIGWFSIYYDSGPNQRTAELDLAQALAQQTTLAIQMTRLAEQGRQAAVLQERNRMAQDIHDTLAQGFTGILLQLQAAEYAPENDQVRAHIAEARDLARYSLQEARRSVRALRPHSLESDQLPGALAHLVRMSTSAAAARTTLDIVGEPYQLAEDVEDHLFRIAQEALTNAVKHSGASGIRISLSFQADAVVLRIQDDGNGFDVNAGIPGNGFGLTGMYERTEQLGGQLALTTAPGNGTSVTVSVSTARGPTEKRRY